jgi:hypothetical protein
MGKLIKGIFGMDSGEKQAQAGIAAGKAAAQPVYFKPVTMTTTMGGMNYTPTGVYEAGLAPALSTLQQTQVAGAQNLYGALSQFDPNSAAQTIFQEEVAALLPTLQAQQIQAGQAMFKTGRGDLRISGAAYGAPQGAGLINPDAYGLMQAQTAGLGELAATARSRAIEQAMGMGQLGAGMLGSAVGLEEVSQKLIGMGIDAESARAAAAAGAGQLATGGYNMATQAAMNADNAMGSFWGGLFGGAGAAYGAYKNPNSDIALKEDIKLVGTLPNGINLYSWSWNSIAKKLGIDKQPTTGVLAQEVQKVIPDAVEVHPENGYLAVDYSKILEA